MALFRIACIALVLGLNLEDFEDDDCIESSESELMLRQGLKIEPFQCYSMLFQSISPFFLAL